MSTLAVQQAPELFRGTGKDGIEYAVRPFRWSLEMAEKYFQKFMQYRIFTDDVPPTVDGFLNTMVGSHSLWFEMVNVETDENVAFLYLTDFVPSLSEKRFISATFHAVTWDARAAPRLELAKRFIKEVFRQFGFHRLQAAVPLNKGGAIRTLHRLGFQDEGVMREPIRYQGQWFGILLMSILEGEVLHGYGSD